MLVDLQERVRNALATALGDQKASNGARAADRTAFQSALDAAAGQLDPGDSEFKEQLTVALGTLKQEQHDDERGVEILARSAAAALAKLEELAAL